MVSFLRLKLASSFPSLQGEFILKKISPAKEF